MNAKSERNFGATAPARIQIDGAQIRAAGLMKKPRQPSATEASWCSREAANATGGKTSRASASSNIRWRRAANGHAAQSPRIYAAAASGGLAIKVAIRVELQRPAVNARQSTGPKSAAAGRDAHSRHADIRPRHAEPHRVSPPRLPAP